VAFESYPILEWGSDYLLNEVSLDTIYKISKRELSLRPFITRTPAIHSMAISIYLYPLMETDKYIFMRSTEIKYDMEREEGGAEINLLYDKQDKKTYTQNLYNKDITDKIDIEVSKRFENTVIKSYSAEFLVGLYKEGKLTGALSDIVSQLNEEDNPVLLLAKFQ